MRGQFGILIPSIILLVILGIFLAMTVFVVNLLKLPLIFIIAILSYSMMYSVMKGIVRNKKIDISVAVIFSVILSYALYTNWLYLLIGFAILIPLYGVIKDFIGSPLKDVAESMKGVNI